MLKNIKSKYNLKTIIKNINYEIKLKIFKLNNKIKDILNIDLIEYKILSGRFIIGKRNGYAKEYDSLNNKLIFNCNYKEGKKIWLWERIY